jgi:2,4-dienoyl-CoA reductase-like NADH-dependent reductase (Old Yellow Enzyme family)
MRKEGENMKLLEPIRLRGLEVRNRIVMGPMTTRLAGSDGQVTDEFIEFYAARARGGVGLIIVELSSPHPGGSHRRGEVGIYSDKFLPGLTQLANKIKEHGACASVQIGHAGAHARPDVTGYEAVGPSDVPHSVLEGDVLVVHPRPLTVDEIRELVDSYAQAAQRLKKAGFDAVEIQGSHDYLIAQFLSPLDNLRKDEYGGDLHGRARFALEIVRACRKAVGDMPILFRLNGDEFAEGGFSHADACELAPMLEQAGVDAIHVSGGSSRSKPSPIINIAPMAFQPGLFVSLAKAIKARVNVPVIAANRLHEPEIAEYTLQSGSADMITLGRPLIADPDWVEKLRTHLADEIRPCLACNTCVSHMRGGNRIACLVNPLAAKELTYKWSETKQKRRILVVGGGPGGMTVAFTLALRGHEVILCERSEKLGGSLWRAMRAPYFQEVESTEQSLINFIIYLERMVQKSGVQVHLGVNVDVESVRSYQPDVIVVSEGMKYKWPLGAIVPRMLESGLAKNIVFRWIARQPRMKKALFKELRTPRRELGNALEAAGFSLYRIGECSGSIGTEETLASATRLAYDL